MPRTDGLPITQINQVIYDVVREIRVGAGRAQQYGGPMQMPEFVDFSINVLVSQDALLRTEVQTSKPGTTQTRTDAPSTSTRTTSAAVDTSAQSNATDTSTTTQTQVAGGSNTQTTNNDYE